MKTIITSMIFLLATFASADEMSKALNFTIPELSVQEKSLEEVVELLNADLKKQKINIRIFLRLDKNIKLKPLSLKAKNKKVIYLLSEIIKNYDFEFKSVANYFYLGNDKKVDWMVTKFYPVSSKFTYKIFDAIKDGKTIVEYFKDKGVIVGENTLILQGASRLVVDATMKNHAKIPKVLAER